MNNPNLLCSVLPCRIMMINGRLNTSSVHWSVFMCVDAALSLADILCSPDAIRCESVKKGGVDEEVGEGVCAADDEEEEEEEEEGKGVSVLPSLLLPLLLLLLLLLLVSTT